MVDDGGDGVSVSVSEIIDVIGVMSIIMIVYYHAGLG